MFMKISNGFAFLYCMGWKYAEGVHNPNDILGVLVRQNFPGLVQFPDGIRFRILDSFGSTMWLPRPRQIRSSTWSNGTPQLTWCSTAFE